MIEKKVFKKFLRSLWSFTFPITQIDHRSDHSTKRSNFTAIPQILTKNYFKEEQNSFFIFISLRMTYFIYNLPKIDRKMFWQKIQR